MKGKIFSVFVLMLLLIGIVGQVAADSYNVAYVLKDTSSPNAEFVEVMNELGYVYELIDDSVVSETDFGNYDMILLGNENIDDVPVNDFPSLIVNSNYNEGWSSEMGSVRGSNPLTANNVNWDTSITKNLHGIFQVYTQATFDFTGIGIPLYYLKGTKFGAVKVTQTDLTYGDDTTRYVVATKEDPNRVFFGITYSEYWTPESRQLFKNAMKWVLNGEEINVAPELVGEIPDQEWSMGETKQIDLDNYFSDYNDDNLVYEVADTSSDEHITVTIADNIVTFSSEPNWVGEDWVIFSASDDEFSVESNEVGLVVNAGDRAPIVELQSPTDASHFEGTRNVLFEFEADDNYEDDLVCRLLIDDEVVGEELALTAGDSGSFDVDGVNDGLHEWNVECSNSMFSEDAPENWSFTLSAPDAPQINPITNKVLRESELVRFTVTATDQDGDAITLTAEGLPAAASFVDNGDGTGLFEWQTTYNDSGIYDLTFTAEDVTALTDTEPVKITVRDQKEPPKFSDIDVCELTNGNLEIKIKEPDDGDEFELGENIEIEVEIENEWEDDLDVDVEVYLYNADDEEVVEEADDSIDVDEGKDEELVFTLEIPTDIDADQEYVLFVKAEDNGEDVCNERFIEVEIEKPENMVVIQDVNIRPDQARKGEEVKVEVEVENIGDDDEEVVVELTISELGISIKSDEVDVDEDDEEKIDLKFEVPGDAEAKFYDIEIKVEFKDGDDKETESFEVINGMVSQTTSSGSSTSSGTTYSDPIYLGSSGSGQQTTQKLSPTKNQGFTGYLLEFGENASVLDYLLFLGILLVAIAVIVTGLKSRRF